MFLVKFQQLGQHVGAVQPAGMMVQSPAADHLEDGPRDAIGHATANVAGIDAALFPKLGFAAIVRVALDQAVGNAHPRGAQAGVAEAGQRAVGAIHLVALITRGKQPGAAGDRLGVGVVFDGPHLSCQFAGA